LDQLGKDQGAVGKVERCQRLAARQLCSCRAPVQPAGNHQVKHQPKIILDANRNAFADAAQLADHAAFHVGKRRISGSQQEGALQAHVLDGLTDYSWLQGADVGGDVGQFWHGYTLRLGTAKYNAGAEPSCARRTAAGGCSHISFLGLLSG